VTLSLTFFIDTLWYHFYYSVMKMTDTHRPGRFLGRYICLALAVLLLGTPILSAACGLMVCGGSCPCKPVANNEAILAIGGQTGFANACCGPPGSRSCHLSVGDRSDVSPVWLQTTLPPSPEFVRLLGFDNPSTYRPANDLFPTTSLVGPLAHFAPLYLTTCRLIC
jgi:hypothetical protein